MPDNGNATHDTLTVLHRLQAKPDILKQSKVVGRWVWITFATIPDRETRDWLKAEGFRFNWKRQVWQHSGGRPSHSSPGDPRFRYGEIDAEAVLSVG